MPDVASIARTLLEEGRVEAVIGYIQSGLHRTRPFIARTPDEADLLVWNHSSLNNLAVYLTRAKRPCTGPVAIVAKGCDLRAIVMLIQEQQVARESVHIIGVQCGGVTAAMGEPLDAATISAKCLSCSLQTPFLFDSLAGEAQSPIQAAGTGPDRIKEVEALSADDRFAFWTAEFERCIRCHACRQACPMCYCEQCVAEKNMPQWIETSATPRANLAWNLIRAFHLGGRCIGCNECERACPVGIPLSLLNRKLAQTAVREFGYAAGMDSNAPTLVGNYNANDRQEYIR
jgi:formate dehydrogenase subunit beta